MMFPRKRYKEYLNPGSQYDIPESTKRSRVKGPSSKQSEKTGNLPCEERPDVLGVGQDFSGSNEMTLDSLKEQNKSPSSGTVVQSIGLDEVPTGEGQEHEYSSPIGSDEERRDLAKEENFEEYSESWSCSGSFEQWSESLSPESLEQWRESHSPGTLMGGKEDQEERSPDEREIREQDGSGGNQDFGGNENRDADEDIRCDFAFEDANCADDGYEGDSETHGSQNEGDRETPADLNEGRRDVHETAGEECDGIVFGRAKKTESYAEKYNLHEVVGRINVTKSKFEVLLMIFHIVLRHGMTGPFVEDMLSFFNAICGQEVLPASKYLFNRIFEPSLIIKFHYFCTQCSLYLGERETFDKPTIVCPTCKTACDVRSLSGTNFFISLPLKEQLEKTLQKPGIKILSNASQSPNICDIRDGELFKKLCEPGGPLADEDAISITFNTDGAAVFESGENSLWPIWCMINNLDPTQRFLGENVILSGLWFGKKSPNFSFFLTPFIKELQQLVKPGQGITLKKPDGEVKTVSVVATTACFESVAKPKVVKQKQYNGFFSCLYCLHRGNIVGELKNVRFPVSGFGEYPKRTCECVREDMFQAHSLDLAGRLKKTKNTEDHVNGLLGISPLLGIPGQFDVVRGVVIDYMHNVPLGIVCKLVELFEEKKEECIIEGMSLAIVDKRLTKLKPPSNVQNPPLPLSKKSVYKAKDFRSLLLYYMLPCLRDVLKPRYYENMRMLVKAIFILLKDSIPPEDLNEAEHLLKNFVRTFNELYGDANMIYNVHISLHLVDFVRWWGPLWAFSAFAFESANGLLLKLNKGTRGVATQVCLKYCMVRSMREYIEQNDVSPQMLDFCGDVIAFKYAVKSEEFDSNVRSLTSEVVRKTDDEERNLLVEAGFESVEELCTFNRVLKDRNIFCSSVYTKPIVFNDTCVRFADGKYGVLKKIFKISDSNELWGFVNVIRIASEEHLAPHLKICSHDLFEPLSIKKMSDVKVKCLLLIVDDVTYVGDFPNFFEVH